jgi:putative solute:sodium symporter small subunit
MAPHPPHDGLADGAVVRSDVLLHLLRARTGRVHLFGWPLSFYMAAQGMMLIYLAIVVIYVRRMRRIEQLVRREQGEHWHGSNKDFFQRLCRYYGFYTLGFIVFLCVLAVLEREGMPRSWIGYLFLFVTIGCMPASA